MFIIQQPNRLHIIHCMVVFLAAVHCGLDDMQYDGSCYKFVRMFKSFEDAESFCEEQDMSLTDIQSDEELDKIAEYAWKHGEYMDKIRLQYNLLGLGLR